MGQYINEENNLGRDQSQEMNEIIEKLKTQVKDDLKILFFSSNNDRKNHYISYRFPIEKYDENFYNAIIGYARQDMITRKQLGEKITDTTRLLFCDKDGTYLGETYNLKHDQEFLDYLNQEKEKTL